MKKTQNISINVDRMQKSLPIILICDLSGVDPKSFSICFSATKKSDINTNRAVTQDNNMMNSWSVTIGLVVEVLVKMYVLSQLRSFKGTKTLSPKKVPISPPTPVNDAPALIH